MSYSELGEIAVRLTQSKDHNDRELGYSLLGLASALKKIEQMLTIKERQTNEDNYEVSKMA